ncbi:VanZ family protein [Bacillaceae bacterium Marseille-Q3522]|nr:VanZ family protein [Bacillaceae bacterium Marseille-Q3522]
MYLINGNVIVVFGTICYILWKVVQIGRSYKNNKPIFWRNEAIKFLFVVYILMVISVTLFPLALWIDFNVENITYSLNFVPFVSIIDDFRQIGVAYSGDAVFMIRLIIRNVGGNILLFMPLGFLVPIFAKKYRHFKNTILLGFFASISIEIIQFFELFTGGMGRAVDIDDVICNVIGASIGYLIFKMIVGLAEKFHLSIFKI